MSAAVLLLAGLGSCLGGASGSVSDGVFFGIFLCSRDILCGVIFRLRTDIDVIVPIFVVTLSL